MHPTFAAPARALVRAVPGSYRDCLREHPAVIDTGLARRQHAAYVTALFDAGVDVHVLPADEAHPDCCYVEDTAVILDQRALITVPGAPSRRGECPAIAAALAAYCGTQQMFGPGTLDGGDVMRVGRHLYVGLSSRTDRAGVDALAGFAALHQLEVRAIPLALGLHLKTIVTLADPHTLVLQAGALDPAVFAAADVAVLEVPEPVGANVLALGRRVLVSTAAPRTADRLAALGLTVVPLDISEFNKGDGAFTCLSLRVPRPGEWCA